MLTNLIMLIMIGIVIFIFSFPIIGKSYPFQLTKKKKKKKNSIQDAPQIDGNFQELMGIRAMYGDIVELDTEKKTGRNFLGLIRVDDINYLLRSLNEQRQTDLAFETLLAQLNLGPGREVNVGIHIQSRPIDLSEQLKPYQESFGNLNPIAQRYAQSMFFPFMEYWQQTVDEYGYQSYFRIDLKYSELLLEDLEEDQIIMKVRNEFNRVASIIQRNYNSMGGQSAICNEYLMYEALYFAVNKQTSSLERFKNMMAQEGLLSPFVTGDAKSSVYVDDIESEEGEKREVV
ncbi:hypothetical protein BKP35_16430 [Anaerobacillus arseniciselenatis]|uniref:Uncharacterized protein n=1 Tax=Anaerobacillus arseniciselenatis TaxID=85682 RepID=A0A1S2LB27_9BACI|nr:hypothetical protein [Anaerobacillus arseniciselenatis]OIJ09440.1 hypothetical protein BKP35_16430 [Anaerobacillus arseniciselenatis]